jgi:hypothetical protein
MKKKKKKTVKGQRPQVFSVFAPYRSKSLQTHPLSFHEKHICFTGYIGDRGTEVYLIRSPHPCLCRGPPSLTMQALLVTLIGLFLNYKPSAGRGEPGLPGFQGKQASQNR